MRVPGTLVEDGTDCFACGRYTKLYKRTMTSAAALWMIKLYRINGAEGREFVYMPPKLKEIGGTASQGGYGNLGQHWELVDRKTGRREDGSTRIGFWRLNDDGRAFVLGDLLVPKHAHIYDNRVFDFDGPPWSIYDALGEDFDYNDVMNRDLE